MFSPLERFQREKCVLEEVIDTTELTQILIEGW